MEQIPAIYQNRNRLLKIANDLQIPSSVLYQLTKSMRGKTEEEKEEIAKQLIRDLQQRNK